MTYNKRRKNRNFKIDLILALICMIGIVYMLMHNFASKSAGPPHTTEATMATVEYDAIIKPTVGVDQQVESKASTVWSQSEPLGEAQSDSTMTANQYELLYNVFWHKFNTYAALTADYDNNMSVSSTEVAQFKNELLTRLGLRISPDNDLLIIDKFNRIVPPEQMFCYLNNYDSKTPDQKIALDACSLTKLAE